MLGGGGENKTVSINRLRRSPFLRVISGRPGIARKWGVDRKHGDVKGSSQGRTGDGDRGRRDWEESGKLQERAGGGTGRTQ